MADDRPLPPAPQPHEQDTIGSDLDAAYAAAGKAFKAHIKVCYACRCRGTDCYDVGALKQRMRDTESALTAAKTAVQ